MAARLYTYQMAGVACLAAAVLREHDGGRRALVACPASLEHQRLMQAIDACALGTGWRFLLDHHFTDERGPLPGE